MKFGWLFAVMVVPYGMLVPQTPGNPNGDAYAGQPGSVYDAAANPPQTIGVSHYDPYAPLPVGAATPIPVPPTNLTPAR